MRSNEITMSTTDMNKVENEEENKTPDKKQIEAEEKEVMLKVEDEGKEVTEVKVEGEGPVKAALACAVTEQGREVKPKFIPIGAIKMPGFFTRNSDKEKKEDDGIEKDGEEKDENKPKRHRLQFLHTCPFTQFLHHPRNATTEEQDGGNNAGNAPGLKERLANLNLPNIKYPKMFQKHSTKDAEATLASMETLEDKLDTPNDGMENVKLEVAEEEGKVATKLPLKERIRQKKFIMDDIVVAAVVLLVLVAVIVGVAVGARAGPPAERPLRLGRYITTITSCGEVEGILDEGVYKFYSIPYAPPPVGERRFAYTQPLNNLSMCWNGTLQVHNRGPLCIQFLENGTITGDEDCLTLDIVTPHVRYDSPLPVVVLIGTNTLAGGISPAQPSALYARTKEVVFVRPNFRLGPFGFLALDILSTTKYPATSGNYALTDLLTTLDWVNKNIKHFGGDPNSVTLLGHRAGATLTAALTTIKKAQPLFSRAWLSSPSVVFEAQPLEKAEKENEQVKQLTKCQDVQCLRRISATEILTAIPEAWLSDNSVTLPTANENRHSWLVLDGDLLRMQINESWAEQKKIKEEMGKNVFKPMIMGTTQHSGHSQALRMKHLNWTSELVEQMVNNSAIGEKLGAEVYTQFNKTYEGLTELIAALRTLCPLHRASQSALGVPLYVVLGAGAGGGAGGARLAPVDADVQAILGTFDSDMPEQRRFMAAMQQLFYYYVWHGNLAGPETALIAVGQDLLPLPDLPACRFLAEKGLVPNYAHVD